MIPWHTRACVDAWQVLNTYLTETMGTPLELEQIWGADREGESQRFAEHDAIKNRKLLWCVI